jgi:hypothetical protein
MTTFEDAITRAETDLTHVQSALDAAQQVLEVADRAHGVGRRLFRMLRFIAVVLGIVGFVVAAFVIFDRLLRPPARNPEVTADNGPTQGGSNAAA